MCELCARGPADDGFNPGDPNVEVANFYGFPVLRKDIRAADGTEGSMFGVPKDIEIPPAVRAENEGRANDMMDTVDGLVDMGASEDAVYATMYMTIRDGLEHTPSFVNGHANVLTTFLMEAARLRREVRKLTEGLFGPQDGPLAPEQPTREGRHNPPPPWA